MIAETSSSLSTSPLPRICLNMIVKNESKVIRRLLTSVLPLIDTYCICDTGSTDDTETIIREFFAEHNIEGRIVHEPFRDFGYNRTHALTQCDTMEGVDYILLIDADMVLQVQSSVETLKRKLWANPAHYVFQGTEKFYYKNVRFVKHRSGMSYWGVTHEYVKVPEGTTYGMFEKDALFIHDLGDGGSKADKYERDIRLLTQGLEQEPNNDRYTFYLANSLRDANRTEEAIAMFKKRVEIGGWIEEIWHSLYSIGKCYQKMGEMEKAVYYWMEAYAVYPRRIENLYRIINHYRERGKNELAYSFYSMADKQRQLHPPQDYLFMEKELYDHKLDYELTIVGYYCNHDGHDLPQKCVNVLCYPHIEEWMSRNILSNYKFYAPKLRERGSSYTPLSDALFSMVSDPNFTSSTPSITYHENKLIVNVRYVNYHIDERGGYVQKDTIETRNVVYIQEEDGAATTGQLLQHVKALDNTYIGLEDVRLFSHGGKVYYNANRGLGYSTFVIEHGEIDLATGETQNTVLLNCADQHQVEKNWVLFSDGDDRLKCIYKWHPMQVGDIHPTTGRFTTTHEIPTPRCFKHFRGSTCGVRVGDEIWFICHIVSYEDRRYYYHVLIAVDPRTYEIRRFSRFFTFEGDKVEYTLGFVVANDMVRIGYSTMDRTTKFMEISREKLENLFM